jgi:hypothetical protein
VTEFAALAEKYGIPVAALLIVLWTNQRGVWCWRSVLAAQKELLAAEEKRHAETKAERDRWQASFFHAIGLANSATNVLVKQAVLDIERRAQ